MNICMSALLYNKRKWKKTLILFFLLFFIVSLVLSGISILNAEEKESKELRGTTGAGFVVERDTSTGGWTSDNHGTYSTQEFVTEEMLKKISSVDGIAGYDASIVAMPTLYSNGETLITDTPALIFYVYGSMNTEYNPLFLSGSFELVEGSHITENIENGLIINKERAELNGVNVGDKVSGIIDNYSDDPEVEMEIVGIFDIVVDKDDEANMYDDSTMWDYTDYAFCSINAMKDMAVNYGDGNKTREAHFYVDDAAQLDNVIKEVKNISSINWDNFIIEKNDEVYQNISSSLSDTSTLITTLIIVITIVSMALIILILSMSMRSRNREIGILLAIGTAKPSILLQYVIETLMTAAVAFPLAYLFSRQIADEFGALFGKAAENIFVTSQYFALITVVGTMLLIVAVLISCIPVMRYKPKEILAQME